MAARLVTALLGVSLAVGCDASVHRATSEKAPMTTSSAVERIHFVGRFDTRDPRGPRFDWPGTAIAATFDGTGIELTLRDSGGDHFAIAVDGAPKESFTTAPGIGTYALAKGLSPGRHTVVLTKRTEPQVGQAQLLGVNVLEGALVPTAWPTTRRLEFVGDSITCGYGNLGATGDCPFTPATEDQTRAYGALAAARLQADQMVIAYSGIGMLRDSSGVIVDQMPIRYERALAKDPTSAWSFSGPAPDAVIINLGTNDFAQGDPGPAFVRAYVAFVKRLRERYPSSLVFCTVGPMYESDRKAAEAYIHQAVNTLAANGDTRVIYLPFEEQRPRDGYGCNGHPNLVTHQRMAEVLVGALREQLGW